MRRCIGAYFLVLVALPALASELRVLDGRTPPPLPGTSMMAGYLTIENEGDEPVTVTDASSPAFGRISLHRSVEADGQARMEPVESLSVGPGERVVLQPGGLHLMMFEPSGEPEAGDRLQVVLQTDAGTIPVELRVVERSELLPR